MREGELNPARGALKPADHVRYGAHNGPSSDIAACPRSASGIAIPHYAAIFFAGSRSVNRAGQLRNDLAPKVRRPRSPIRAIETSARYDRRDSSRETERVRRDPLASSFPHRPVVPNDRQHHCTILWFGGGQINP